MKLKEDILLIIKKLSELAGKSKNHIEESEKSKKILIEFKLSYEKLDEELKKEIILRESLQKELTKVGDILNREAKLLLDEKSLELNRLKFDITKQIEEIKVKESEKRSDSLFTLVGLLCKNSEDLKMIDYNVFPKSTNSGTFQHNYIYGKNNFI